MMGFHARAQGVLPEWGAAMGKCFKQITSKTKCPISEREDLFQTVNDITHWTYEMNREFSRFDLKCENKEETLKGKVIRSKILEKLKSEIKRNNLSRCQQACVVNCFSSHFINKKDFYGTIPVATHGKMHGLFELYKIQAGECTEFARVNEDLLEALGFETKISAVGPTESNPGHAFSTVKVNGTWYHMNTPIEECLFYRLRSRGEYRTEQEWIDNSTGSSKTKTIESESKKSPAIGN